MDAELRIRAGDLASVGVDDDMRAPCVAERGQGVGCERGLGRRLSRAEVVEALAATGRAEHDGEHEEEREAGSEAAHEADIGSARRNPRLEGGLRT